MMFSEPAVGEAFFGREEVLELLNKRVTALKDGYRQNVALTGQSLAGKSSIIYHFLYTLKEQALIPVYVEVVREGFESFANKFIATLLYNALTKMGEPVDIDREALVKRAEKCLPKTHLAIRQLNSNIDRGQYDEAYASLLGLTSTLKDETGMSCVVILDEFDNLECLGVKNPFLSFGKVIMVEKDTMYIVSSSRNEAIKKILSEKLSLLFGNFEIVKVAGFDLKTAASYIDMKLAGYELDGMMRRFLISFTDGNAFYMDKLICRARELAAQRMSNHIDRGLVADAMVDIIYNSNGIIHQYIVNFMLELLETRRRDSYIAMLISIANGRRKLSEIARGLKVKASEVSHGLAHLMELGVVSKCGVFYKIDDIVLAFWLKFVYQRRKDILVDGAFDRRRLFREDADSYLADFGREAERDAGPILAELFNLFSNEMVSIDSKSVRLPHFTRVETRAFPNAKQFVAASFRGRFWIAAHYQDDVGENDVIDYVKNVKALGLKVASKIIIPLEGIDENARLLAKELKISIWDGLCVNTLLTLYGKKKLIRL